MQTVWKIVYLSYNTSIHLFTKRLFGKSKHQNDLSGRRCHTNLFNTNASSYKVAQDELNILRSVVVLHLKFSVIVGDTSIRISSFAFRYHTYLRKSTNRPFMR